MPNAFPVKLLSRLESIQTELTELMAEAGKGRETDAPPQEKKRRGPKPLHTEPMIALASRISVTLKQRLTELAYCTGRTETSLIDEAVRDLLLKHG